MEKFNFVPPKPNKNVNFTIIMSEHMLERLQSAVKSLPDTERDIIINHKTRRGRKKSTYRELVRQMIDHCLTDMGF